MASALSNPGFESAVLAPLAALGRRLKRVVLMEGLCQSLAIMVVAAGAQFAIDKLLVLGIGPRAVLLAAVLGLVGHRVWKGIVRPGLLRIDVNDVAAVVERRHPGLNDALSSAVAFATGGRRDPRRDSPAMVCALMDAAASRWRSLSPGDLHRRDRHRRSLAAGCAAGLAAAAVAWQWPDLTATYLARNVALQDVPWPSRISLVVEGFAGGRLRWPIGDDLPITVTAPDEVPRGLRAEFEFASGETASRDMARRGDRRFVLDFGPLQQSMKMRFLIWKLGVDERTDWYEIDAVRRPGIRTARIEVSPPDYAGLAPFALAEGQTHAEVLRGSAVRIDAEVNKPVVRAALRFADRRAADAEILPDRRVSTSLRPEQSGAYFFDLEDEDGLADLNPVNFNLRILNDPPPKVRLTLPGAGGMVVPSAVPILAVDCEDDLGLRSVDLLFVVARESSPASAQPQREAMPDLTPRQMRYTIERPWPLTPLGLQPGDQVTLKIRAADYQPSSRPTTQSSASTNSATSEPALSGRGRPGYTTTGAPVGESVGYTLRIVTAEELQAELGRRENEWRREFEQIIEAQERLNDRVRELREQAETLPSTSLAARYAQEERFQRQQANRVRTVLRQFEQIFGELEINQLATPAVRRRLKGGVIRGLQAIISAKAPAASDLLAELGRDFDAETADRLGIAQKELLQAMYAALVDMLKWEGYDEAVALLRDIIRLQGDVNLETEKRLKQQVEELFGQPPASQPADDR